MVPSPPAGQFPASSSVDWLRRYLPAWAGNALAGREAQALATVSGRQVAGDMLSTAMNILPAGRFISPRPGIRAYHGSPYDFDRFDLSKIGTGEGAQSYGHGLYFAENPKVAQAYKDQAISPMFANNPNFQAWMAERGRPLSPKMYEVNINAQPEQFLDWDRPLSGQNPDIANRVEPLLGESRKYAERGDNMGAFLFSRGREIGHPQVSEALRDAGIPGIRYLDQGSRVMEAPEHLAGRLEEIQSQMDPLIWASREGNHTPAQGAAYDRLFNERAAVRDQIKQWRRANQTSNYVLFNDKIIDILKKWGLVGMLGGGSVNAIDNRNGT
jgi:hypothetical protein